MPQLQNSQSSNVPPPQRAPSPVWHCLASLARILLRHIPAALVRTHNVLYQGSSTVNQPIVQNQVQSTRNCLGNDLAAPGGTISRDTGQWTLGTGTECSNTGKAKHTLSALETAMASTKPAASAPPSKPAASAPSDVLGGGEQAPPSYEHSVGTIYVACTAGEQRSYFVRSDGVRVTSRI
jgi:hypothetical protein